MILIVSAALSTEPSEGLYFRYLNMTAKTEMDYDIVLESEKEMIDYYWKFLKQRGWFDFVDDFVEPRHRTEGARIQRNLKYPMTIQTPYIKCENVLNLTGQLKSMRDMVI